MVGVSMFRATYMVIRYIPNILREEFVNVGVLLICPEAKFQGVRAISTFGEGSRVKLLGGGDSWFVHHALSKLGEAVNHHRTGEILGNDHRFLTLQDLGVLWQMYGANNIQLTKPRSAATSDPEAILNQLFQDYVGEQPAASPSRNITRTVINRRVHSTFAEQGLFKLGLEEDWRVPVSTEPTIDYAYRNGVWNCYQSISFAGREQQFSLLVNAYRQIARDAEKSADEAVKKAKFTVLGYKPMQFSKQVKNNLAALKEDKIEVVDFNDAPDIALDIKKHLETHQLVS